MADPTPTPATALDPTKLDVVQDLLSDLKGRAREADQQKDLFMLAVYNDLLSVTSDIVVRAHARLEREQKAALNKREKALRLEEKQRREAAREAAKAQAAVPTG